ncbi:germin-like protein 9-3 [Dorcoceras hygrometricum]|uniref:Germin-like protein n=1 Tax=Dorcoceras hygrometricum TaxID=472368 RepID=A0A2Z7B8K9_9LAMI|nr:germin-like protein 9-3 [Dorcoceras hygrometricum]
MSFGKKMIFLVLVVHTISLTAKAGDPDILTDFILPPNRLEVGGDFFTFTGFRSLVTDPIPPSFKVIKANMELFPALNGQSVSYAALVYPRMSVNPVHTHPRSAELLFVLQGSLEVGFVDTKNKLYCQSLQTGDIFVFPKGLVHFQYNADPKNPAMALSAFGSASPGTVLLPNTLFNSTIDDSVLALSFKTDVATIQKIKAGLKG